MKKTNSRHKLSIFFGLTTAMLLCILSLSLFGCEDSNEYAIVSENNLSKDGFYYTLYENNTAVITGYETPGKKTLSVPSKIGSSKVTAIGEGAFESYETLKYVELAEGIRAVEQNAFRGCTALLRMDLAPTITTIGDSAFENCTMLCEVNYGSKLTVLGNSAFAGCISLSVFEIPETMETIGELCFSKCASLPKAVLPKNIKTVGFGAFSNCDALTYVDLGGLKEVPASMFEKAESLLEIDLDKQVTVIGERAFRGAKNLAEVSLNKNITYIGNAAFETTPWLLKQTDEFVVVGDGILLKYNGKSPEVTIPRNVKIIADAFSGMNKLESITIGAKVTKIAEYAFSGCTKLKTVTVSGKVTSVESCAFLGCVSLESVEFPETLVKIGDNAFGNCAALKTVTYNGPSENWYDISIGKGNLYLQSAEMIYR